MPTFCTAYKPCLLKDSLRDMELKKRTVVYSRMEARVRGIWCQRGGTANGGRSSEAIILVCRYAARRTLAVPRIYLHSTLSIANTVLRCAHKLERLVFQTKCHPALSRCITLPRRTALQCGTCAQVCAHVTTWWHFPCPCDIMRIAWVRLSP